MKDQFGLPEAINGETNQRKITCTYQQTDNKIIPCKILLKHYKKKQELNSIMI